MGLTVFFDLKAQPMLLNKNHLRQVSIPVTMNNQE